MPTVSLPTPLLPRRTRPGSEALEAALVRRSVGARAAGRHHCRHCRRTPLLGEHAYLFGRDIVCELCLPLRTAAPDEVVLVRSPEQASAVRTVRRA